MRGFSERIVLALVCFVALVVLACPKPGPPVVNPPDASDAAPAMDARRPATCAKGCENAVDVCPSVDLATCKDECSRIGGTFPARLAAAADCAGVKVAGAGR